MNEQEQQQNKGDSDRGITKDVATSVVKGAVKGVGESLKTIELLADLAQDYIGVQASVSPTSPKSKPVSAGQALVNFSNDAAQF